MGVDRLSDEMIKNTPIHSIEIILQVFNKCLTTGDIPKIWCYGLITPIYKKGNKLNPDNYRGICVMNAILKVLCLTLNERLKSYLYKLNTINKAQIGFKAKCRTSDHILTLKTIINKHAKDKNKKKVVACFVDFRKAYDSIWQKGLFHKLNNNGINEPFLSILKRIYSNSACAVKIGNKHTQFFQCTRGLRQGCPLSPNLFNIYVNDLFSRLLSANSDPLSLNQIPVSALMYADDLVILSTTQEGLQKCLDELYKYYIEWKLDVNIDKTKCMQFMKISKLHNQQFRFGDRTIKNVKEFTYLGITFNGSTSFQPALKELSNKANRALFSLNSKYKLSKLPLDIAIKLFDVMISPILLYGSEVWGAYEYNSNQENLHKWDKSPIKAVHTQFLKRLLGVNRSTTNVDYVQRPDVIH